MANKVKLTGLWEKQVNGKTVLNGRVGNLFIEIWPNGYKKEEKHPDYIVYLKEPEKKESYNKNDDELPF